ncbi:hypothetical protein E2C01_093074 [Portunus trituberculatus]|uniref:Uncharacterized protein n=1 Tax=Portunus trituberculatus TaxID=210409 RepID=A0A5B7JT28_PORTR|nr:hypothetical protein [Portunus trituberculatus]
MPEEQVKPCIGAKTRYLSECLAVSGCGTQEKRVRRKTLRLNKDIRNKTRNRFQEIPNSKRTYILNEDW